MDLPEGQGDWLAAPGVRLPRAALRFTFSRAGGPGGQNVNKLNTRATLTVPRDALAEAMPSAAFARLEAQAGGRMNQESLSLSSAESRSQLANRRACLSKLRSLLVEAMHRPRPRIATRPSRRARQRRIEAKKERGQRKSARRQDSDPDA